MGQREEALQADAKALLGTFEAILSSLRVDAVPHALTQAFSEQLLVYLVGFKTWKASDEAKLVGRIKLALTALYAEEANDPLHFAASFGAHVEGLRDKLQRIEGPEALAQFDAQRQAV